LHGHCAAAGYANSAGTGFGAVVWGVVAVVVVFYNFAFAYYVAGVVLVFVDYIEFVDCVVAVFYNVLMSYYALRARASENFTNDGFTHFASVCASAVHGKASL
jgi:hypothetical protein